ncbi:MAG: type II secretion system protein [Phycisphaeraceae bacterium]|nr:type II secretion system protein [Phycisphaerae bacterium]MBX3391688.1 type II secretion system protein [Phycisphaeraceae bacterium]
MVVIAILAILTAIILPALARSRDAARQCRCLCQMRTLGQLTAIYADASRDAMPRSQHSAFANRVAPWGYAFFEYLTGRAYSPGDAGWTDVFNGPYRCPCDRRRERWSYGYNVYFELTPAETGGRVWTRFTGIPRPSSTVLFAELSDLTSADHAMAHFWTDFGAPPEVDTDRHRPGSGVVFADGHACTLPFISVFDPRVGQDSFNPHTAQ